MKLPSKEELEAWAIIIAEERTGYGPEGYFQPPYPGCEKDRAYAFLLEGAQHIIDLIMNNKEHRYYLDTRRWLLSESPFGNTKIPVRIIELAQDKK